MVTAHLQKAFPQISCCYCNKSFATKRCLRRHLHQLRCSSCAQYFKEFKTIYCLTAHMQASRSNARDISKCERRYRNNRNLKRLIKAYYAGKNEYKSALSPKVYSSLQTMRRYRSSQHNAELRAAKGINCDICDRQFLFERNLEAHMVVCHKMRDYDKFKLSSEYGEYYKFSCEKCNKLFNKENLLRQHIKKEHSFKTFYRYCRRSLLNQESSVRHNNKISEEFYKCEYCNFSTINFVEFRDHMRYKHDIEYAVSSCHFCFKKFYSKETLREHNKICLPPPNVKNCSHCDKMFTATASLEFHIKIFHPMAQIPDTSTNAIAIKEENPEHTTCASYKCSDCARAYYSERSLKHHIKLKHTTDEAVECEFCHKICNNKYYLASHKKIVHSNVTLSKCDYCDKLFKSKRNIRRHIEYTHLGMQRYKCIECDTLFKEKRSLRKHVRVKHPSSTLFPECHICHKLFESAKSCKIHLKLVHSFNMDTHPCHLCSVSFRSFDSLSVHLQTSHLAEDQIYKCEECNVIFKGQDNFDTHNELYHNTVQSPIKQKILPRCIICMKDFSTRKTLKRHIKKFHSEFDVEELANYGSRKRIFHVECQQCIKKFHEEFYYNIYLKLKHLRDSVVFKCEFCAKSYTVLEYSIQCYRATNYFESKGKVILSNLCTAEMSDNSMNLDHGIKREAPDFMEAESTTCEVKVEPLE